MNFRVALCAVFFVGACSSRSPYYCETNSDCADQEEGRIFCDVNGEHEGLGRNCIFPPDVAADAAVSGEGERDAGASDASLTDAGLGGVVCGLVVFEGANVNGVSDIWSMNLEGEGLVNLTSNSSRDRSPRWSPDGGSIAFVSNRSGTQELWVMDADGGSPRKLTSSSNSVFDPQWSPDGERLLFRRAGGGSDLFSISATGTDERNLTSSPDVLDAEGRWSPGGEFIAWASGLEIWKMNKDGTGKVRLSNSSDLSPAWSPDGARIVFRSSRDGNSEIYVMSADGSQQARVTENDRLDDEPSWSPDGRIVWVSHRSTSPDIMVANPDGSGQRNLTNTFDTESEVRWTIPEVIVHAKVERYASGSVKDIYRRNADGSRPVNLTARSDYSDSSPDLIACPN